MGNPAILVGLAMVLAFQVSIHLRIAQIGRRDANARRTGAVDAARRAREKEDALEEVLARRINLLVRGIQAYHDQLADEFRARIAAGAQRALTTNEQREEAASIAVVLRALAGDLAAAVADLHALGCSMAEAHHAPPPREAEPAAPADADERKTIEMPPPSGAARRAAPARGEGWDDADEKTKILGAKTGGVVVELRPRGGPPSSRALHPPPIAGEEDEAPERPSILPEPRPEAPS